jgi:methionyl-tRNA formyltransferase
MNILFAGTPKPSAKILKALCDDPSINVVGVLTKPDKAQKRGKKVGAITCWHRSTGKKFDYV